MHLQIQITIFTKPEVKSTTVQNVGMNEFHKNKRYRPRAQLVWLIILLKLYLFFKRYGNWKTGKTKTKYCTDNHVRKSAKIFAPIIVERKIFTHDQLNAQHNLSKIEPFV